MPQGALQGPGPSPPPCPKPSHPFKARTPFLLHPLGSLFLVREAPWLLPALHQAADGGAQLPRVTATHAEPEDRSPARSSRLLLRAGAGCLAARAGRHPSANPFCAGGAGSLGFWLGGHCHQQHRSLFTGGRWRGLAAVVPRRDLRAGRWVPACPGTSSPVPETGTRGSRADEAPPGFARLLQRAPRVGCPHGCSGQGGRVPRGWGGAGLLPASPGSAGGTEQPCLAGTGSLLEARRGYALKQNALKIVSLQRSLTPFTRPKSAAPET